MTVAEMIAELSKYAGNLPVWYQIDQEIMNNTDFKWMQGDAGRVYREEIYQDDEGYYYTRENYYEKIDGSPEDYFSKEELDAIPHHMWDQAILTYLDKLDWKEVLMVEVVAGDGT